MGLSWTNMWLHFKSPLRVVVQVLWRSRETKSRKRRRLKQKLDESKRTIAWKDASPKEFEKAKFACVKLRFAERMFKLVETKYEMGNVTYEELEKTKLARSEWTAIP